MASTSVEKFFASRNTDLELTLLNGSEAGMRKTITGPELHRPGLALTGFFERFASKRVQVLGQTELAYLEHLSSEQVFEVASRLFEHDVPLVVISKGITPPAPFLEAADKYHTGVFSSRLTTAQLISRLAAYLEQLFAPSVTLHGTLVDVYGVGLLYTGKSGIGKSEVALDLVERGHRLVADDVVKITRTDPDVIIGTGSE